MLKRHVQTPSLQSDFYRPELEFALRDELRALADIEATYEEQRDRLERAAVPQSVKDHLTRQLEQRRASARDPRVKRLSGLRDEIVKLMQFRNRTVH